MTRTTAKVSITLKPEQIRQIDQVAEREQRSRSQVIGRAVDKALTGSPTVYSDAVPAKRASAK